MNELIGIDQDQWLWTTVSAARTDGAVERPAIRRGNWAIYCCREHVRHYFYLLWVGGGDLDGKSAGFVRSWDEISALQMFGGWVQGLTPYEDRDRIYELHKTFEKRLREIEELLRRESGDISVLVTVRRVSEATVAVNVRGAETDDEARAAAEKLVASAWRDPSVGRILALDDRWDHLFEEIDGSFVDQTFLERDCDISIDVPEERS